jgi:hypothetical protein
MTARQVRELPDGLLDFLPGAQGGDAAAEEGFGYEISAPATTVARGTHFYLSIVHT